MIFAKRKKSLLKFDYIILLSGLLLTFLFYFLFSNRQIMQAGVVICAGIFYAIWGAVHHAKEGDFHPKIALEYLLMATLAVTLLLSVIFRL